MRSKSPPEQGSSPDSSGINRFRVQGSRFEGNCNGIYRNSQCTAADISGQEPKDCGINKAGFTLIEVILALIIVSVLASMVFHITGSGLWRTARGVGECRTLFELQGRMEQIVQIYKKQLTDGNGAVDLTVFQDTVLGLPDVDAGRTGFLSESGDDFSLTPSTTSMLLVTLVRDDQRIASIFAGG